ncbi:16S rRNA (guanine(527)-N(7))-methyltransferase RsmG [Collinsella sp. zg1085]|uniref:16S rRNA (guanine(527)-N(7))-methyltransferase RsmG n=1 Tax=Collinsella sp. zg1085 TaxID=2844380 RepID=UPI001C0CA865|nr:16S rRNA (guanine(527)-N(7))-methyltransferase RsmG [Collinsella sp. zg1085]QWT17597.1 16S rRNA (guanine(527)-N(7))-methyltransferase RsmG [Collinsella sp. zg1085]
MVERIIKLEELTNVEQIEHLATQLLGYCTQYDIAIDRATAEYCVKHLLYVLQINSYINLTRIVDIDDALILHVLDSLLFLKLIPVDCHCIYDMGTGAGYPGLPLNVALGVKTKLLDSVSKKLKAVEAIISKLRVSNCSIHHGRLEELCLTKGENPDIVVARALASLPSLLEYARPFLAIGGSLIVSKGVPSSEELAAGNKVAELLGYSLIETCEVNLPSHLGSRLLMWYQVDDDCSIKLPRAVGMAHKYPLA